MSIDSTPLPPLPQRIRGATLTPSYVDAGVPVGVVQYTVPDDHADPIDSATHRSSSQAGLAALRHRVVLR